MSNQFEDDEWGQVVNGSGDFARVDQLETHLVIVFPRGYIEHHPTRFSQPGKKSDVIVCDVVDLDAADETTGLPGKVYRNAWWRQSQLIISLRPFIDKRVLGRISRGIGRNGMNPPWVIGDSTTEPGAIDRARAWAHANPSFALSPFDPNRLPTVPAPAAPQYPLQGYPQQPSFQDPYTTQAPPQFTQPQPPYPPQGYPPQGYPQAQPQYAPPPPLPPTGSPYGAPGYSAPTNGQGNLPPQQYQPQATPPAFPVPGAPPPQDSMLNQMRAARERQMESQPSQPPF